MKFDEQEMRLIISALENDTVGTWGDGRGEAIDRLIKKIKRGAKK
jgi:hypothetical protein